MESSESEVQSSPNVFRVFTVDTPKLTNPKQVPDPVLKNGRILPNKLQDKFTELKAWGKPLEDIDPYYEKTFIVVSSNFRIFRYSSHHSLFLFEPLNVLRRFFIFILTHWIFSSIMTTVVVLDFTYLVNYQSNPKIIPLDHGHIARWIFFFVYLAEFILKWISMGFAMSPFTYLRSFWSWLDMLNLFDFLFWDVEHYYVRWPIVSCVLLKIIFYNSGLHLAFDFCISCVVRSKEMIIASLVILSMLSILGVQMYMGVLTQKCISNFNSSDFLNVTEQELHEEWHLHSSNFSSWYWDEGLGPYRDTKLCGNSSGTGLCPEGYTCLQGYGHNPDYGYTSFDTFFWGLISALRLVTQDFAERLIRQIFVTAGHFHAAYFLCTIFFGTFGLGTFAYGVVAHTFLEMKDINDKNESLPNQNGQNRNQRIAVSRLFQSWNLPPGFNSFRRQIHCFVFHPFSEVCITCIIIFDVLLMLFNVEQPIFSQIFCCFYLFEFLVKCFAESPRDYFHRREHILDAIISFVYIFTLFIDNHFFSSFLVMRMFKLFPRWPSLNFLIQSFVNTLKNYYYFFSLLLIVILVNAARGAMNLYDGEKDFLLPEEPRWHFKDFEHSFMTVFRIACGEWIEGMWDELLLHGMSGATFFISVLLIIYLILMIASIAIIIETGETFKKIEFQENALYSKFEDGLKGLCPPITWLRSKINPGGQTHNILEEAPIHRESQFIDDTNGNSSPVPNSVVGATRRNESVVDTIIQNKYYSIFSIAVLLWCSFELTFDNVCNKHYGPQANLSLTHLEGNETDHIQPSIIQLSVFYSDVFFTIYFGMHIVLNLISCIVKKRTVCSGWIFDFILIVEMILNLTMYSPHTSPLHGCFYVKCFRPFMLVSRLEGLKAVVNGLITEITVLWKYLLAGCFVLLAFDIQGVQLFQNRFGKCITEEEDGSSSRIHALIIANKSECLTANMTWTNSPANFDNAFNGVLPLFYTLTINGWISVLHDAVDIRGMYDQPALEASFINVFYVMFVITFGSFFIFFILVGIVIHFLRMETYKGIFMTFDQFYEYKNKSRQLLAAVHSPQRNNTPEEKIPEPTWRVLKFFYDIVGNPFFDKFIISVIICQITVLSFDRYQLDQIRHFGPTLWNIFHYTPFVVISIYIFEMIFKLLGWRQHYFKNVYNRIDFVVTISFIPGFIFDNFMEKYFISSYLLTMLRVFRIFQFEPFRRRAVKSQKFLKSLYLIRPALLNLLLFLVINLFSFSLLFMATFKNVKLRAGLNEDFNFHSFRQSISMLFQMSTFGGWDAVYEALGDATECDLPDSGHEGNCGSPFKASVMTFGYLSVSVIIVLNIYIVFILELLKRLSEKEYKRDPNGTAETVNIASSSSANVVNITFDCVNAREFTNSSFT